MYCAAVNGTTDNLPILTSGESANNLFALISASVTTFGSGHLKSVKGGLPGGMTLVASGNLQDPDYKGDFGTWETLAPSKVGGG